MGTQADLDWLLSMEAALTDLGSDLALYLVYERPERVRERPALARTFFAERCTTDQALSELISAFRSIDAYVELFEDERSFLYALSSGRLTSVQRGTQVLYNGIGWGITPGGFRPGRKAMLPAVADSYGLVCANSEAYTCALALHKFHSFVLLRALGVRAPRLWHYRPKAGWMGERPPEGTKVIVKSTYEAWSVGVSTDSVFVVDETCESRVTAISERIGQAVTMQEFVAGREVCMPVLAFPQPIIPKPVEQVLSRAPAQADAVFTIEDNLAAESVSYVPFDGVDATVAEMRATSLKVFDILQMRAFGRMDFRLDDQGRPWLTDAAISPSWDAMSSAYTAFAPLGLSHPTFLRLIIAATLATDGLLGSA